MELSDYMVLTPAQLTALKADIDADPTLSAFPNNSDGSVEIAKIYNQLVNPAFIVWKTAVSMNEIMSNGFRWVDVDSLTAAKYRTWELMHALGTINPSKTNIRQGIRDCWGVGSQQEEAILPHLKRSATRVEKLFATGTGSDASPATMTFEGMVVYQDIDKARNPQL